MAIVTWEKIGPEISGFSNRYFLRESPTDKDSALRTFATRPAVADELPVELHKTQSEWVPAYGRPVESSPMSQKVIDWFVPATRIYTPIRVPSYLTGRDSGALPAGSALIRFLRAKSPIGVHSTPHHSESLSRELHKPRNVNIGTYHIAERLPEGTKLIADIVATQEACHDAKSLMTLRPNTAH